MDILVTPTGAHHGKFSVFGNTHACTLGRAGVTADKREGDGATPAGRFALREIRYRADRLDLPQTLLPATAIQASDGWCDDPADPAYNCAVVLPYDASAETMWRADGLYDLLVILGHNDAPPVPGLGSAIFLHCASPGLDPTEGCIALPHETLRAMAPRLTPDMLIDIRPG